MRKPLDRNQAEAAPAGWKAALVPALLCLLFLINGLNGALRNSAVADEVGGHMAAGYLYWTSGTYSGGIANFPLAHLLIAAPVVLLGQTYELFSEQHLVLFRLPVLLMGLLLAITLYRFGVGLFGRRAGIAALALFSLSPNVLAHASLATLDFPIAFFVFLTVYALWCYVQKPGWVRMLALSAALGCALATKVQALLLIPIVGVVLLVSFRGRLWHRQELARLLLPWLLLPAVPLVLVNALYLHAPWQSGSLLPPLYLQALRFKLFHAQGSLAQLQVAYLCGNYSSEGWWYYFPVAILVKTPLPTLVLLVIGLARKPQRGTLLFVVLPAAALLGVAMASRVNIGLRHVLTVYPFLFLLAGAGAARLWQRPWHGGVLAVLAAGYVWQAAMITPHHLSYFNSLVGGPRDGHKCLSGSNYDWGQNDRFLRRYIQGRGIDYQIDPGAFRPTTGHILVNASALHGLYGSGGSAAYAWLRPFKPVNQIAYTWFEYDVPADARFDQQLADDQGMRNPFSPWREDVDAEQLDAALERVELHLRALSARYADVTDRRFRELLVHTFFLSAAYDSALAEVRLLLKDDPADETALGLGGELMVQLKVGILRFKGDEYLTGFRPAPAGATVDLASAAEAAKLAGIGGRVALVHAQLGGVLAQSGRIDEAAEQLQLALVFNPGDAGVWTDLGTLLVHQGRFEEGRRWLGQALTADASKAEAVIRLARLLEGQGRFEHAIRLLREVQTRVPDDVAAAAELALLLAQCPQVELRNGDEAVRLAEHANQLAQGRNRAVLEALAAAYLATGQAERAQQVQAQLAQLNSGGS